MEHLAQVSTEILEKIDSLVFPDHYTAHVTEGEENVAFSLHSPGVTFDDDGAPFMTVEDQQGRVFRIDITPQHRF